MIHLILPLWLSADQNGSIRRVKPLLQALTPTRWLLLTLVLVLGLRLYDWHACGLLRDLPPVRELAKGLAWDIALVTAVFALNRLLVRLRPRALSLILPLLFGLCAVVRLVDALHCKMAGAHWGADSFQYLDAGFAGSVWEPRYGGALLGFLLVAWLAAQLVRRDARLVRADVPVHTYAIAAFLLLIPGLWALRDAIRFPPQVQEARLIPEVNAWIQWQRADQTPHVAAEAPPLSPALLRKFQHLGLVPPDPDFNPAWPVQRQHIDPQPLPFAKKPNTPVHPNVVLTLMESQNALFVHGLSGHYRGLMPELSALTTHMTVFDHFYNTSAPTIAAMVTALCGVQPSAHPRDLGDGKTVDGQAAYTCLADLLRPLGYRAIFVQGAAKTVTAKEYFLRTHGFDEVIGREELAPLYADRPQGSWGPHDGELVDFVQKKIEQLEQDPRPFLLVMLTLDTHTPGMAGPECQLPAGVEDLPTDAEALKLLASYHCSDKAIGTLGRFLLQPQRAVRTLWLLTADHAAFADMTPANVYLSEENHRHSTLVPLLLHDPLHDLPAHVGTLAETRDLTPTLAHLLGVPDQPISLTGWSIFGHRQQLPFLLGRVGERLAFVRTPDRAVERTVASVQAGCERNETLLTALGQAWTACDMVAWLAWQDALWAGRRLFPAWLYHGADGVDRAWLVEKQERNKAKVQPENHE